MSRLNTQAKWIMNNKQDEEDLPRIASDLNEFLQSLLQNARSRDILPSKSILADAVRSLPDSLPTYGLGLSHTTKHLMKDIAPAVSSSSLSSRYYGFVTGGTTPAARLADYLVTTLDECLAVRIPSDTIASDIENRAQQMLSELLNLNSTIWTGFFTPGSSTSNLYGIACGKEFVLRVRGAVLPSSVGIQEACEAAGVRRVQVLCSMGHPSIMKAASLLGLGRSAVKQCGLTDRPWHLDMVRIQRELENSENASIVSISLGEVNSGKFGISPEEFQVLRKLCDRHQAWLHVDGAFGMFANILPDNPEFSYLKEIAKYIHLADSITGDAHKLLNVPFDCGFFYLRDISYLKDVFGIPKGEFSEVEIPPVYFSRSLPAPGGPPNPTEVGIQNARRFRALPVYASLLAYGRAGYEDMIVRQTSLARGVAAFILDHPAYELLPQMPGVTTSSSILETIFILIVFRAVDPLLNQKLLIRINETGKMYAQGIVWKGDKAIRCAIANWSVNVQEDLQHVTEALKSVAESWEHTTRSRI